MELSKEEFLEQQEQEQILMDAIFVKPPLEVQMGSKKDVLNHIAKGAVELAELMGYFEEKEK